MSRLTVPLLLALAVAVGLLLPGGVLYLLDKQWDTARITEVTEPVLEFGGTKSLSAGLSEDTGSLAIAHKLTCFGTSPSVILPVENTGKEEMLRAEELTISFLTTVCARTPQIQMIVPEHQFAWYEDGTIVEFWTVYVEFDNNWICTVTLDDASGAVLRLFLQGNSVDLTELFPEEFERATTAPEVSFETLVSQRVMDALGQFMGRSDGKTNPVIFGEEPGMVCVTFPDEPELAVPVLFTVDALDGICFNDPAQFSNAKE